MVINRSPFSLLSWVSQHSVFSAWQSPCHLVPFRLPRECKNWGTCTLFWWYLQVCCQGSSEHSMKRNLETRRLKMGRKTGRKKWLERDMKLNLKGKFLIV